MTLPSRAKFTDIFIKRPVLATVISLLIFVVGLRAIFDLNVRQYPKVENTVITVTTSYPGASANLMEGFITSPIEKSIASAEGIDYMTSSSIKGTSTITAYIKLNFDPNTAFTDVMAKVAQVKNVLPKQAQQPVIVKSTGQTTALMYIGFNSKTMSPGQITDYLSRVVQPNIETVNGVASADILGGQPFAMRIWLNPIRMAALGVSATDINNALLRNNFQAAAGNLKGRYLEVPINATTSLVSSEGFSKMVIKHGKKGQLVRLQDVAKVELGAESYDSSVYFNGEKAVFMGIQPTPSANPLSMIAEIKNMLPGISANFPPGLHEKVVYDATSYIKASIYEVIRTIIEAALIVIVVIFLFLGSLRTIVIPIVTIPLSLVGVCGFMLTLGYSLNLLTLLSMVLAIGMVVDDAIVVVENCYRHIEEGLSKFDAAMQGAREIATPVISMTITLAAVYAPIGFMGGLTGALFREFAFTLAAAVIISGIIALTLSPMMCSKVLNANIGQQKMVQFVDRQFFRLKSFYERRLMSLLNFRPVMILFAFVVLLSCFFLFVTSKSELAPTEDQGVVFAMATGPKYANIDYMQRFTHTFNGIYHGVKSLNDYFIVNGMNAINNVITAVILKPWDQRKQSQAQVLQYLQQRFNQVSGLQIQSFPLPSLPNNGGTFPIDFVLQSTQPFTSIFPVLQQLETDAKNSGLFMFINGTLRFNKPQVDVVIDRNKAGQMGINMQDIAQALATAFGENYVNYFNMSGRSYKVIPEVQRRFRWVQNDINNIYIPTQTSGLVPLSTIVKLKQVVEPNALTHFQQLNSANLQGVMVPGHTINEGLRFLVEDAKKIFPQGMSYAYSGLSRQFEQEGSSLIYTFFFSIIIIFLVLAAQFESFRDPLVIMLSVPMAICGAMLPINWGFATVNIYTQIGLITLIGLISKHGILMVDFANHLQLNENRKPHDAIIEAAAIRLRPILMTTAAMVLGVVPLLVATGAGAVSRFDIGLVIACGMTIGTLFTLFVVPTMYLLKPRHIILFLLAALVVGYAINTFVFAWS